ncbi:Calcium/calmodulin-dependent protein kinase type I [Venturia nashicola]|uniref:Calcium/calmodulin-dependent protein kinase type I n=1 Tax=Venturia nashicola TaxID=86259 RepID=A0A4Z1NZ60_9PEZI|nr:Calcium/calmodulin-dependent protein kinase type I [Venturia nashicola]TLD31929.1 Calcium/calmodulin-dependent protein kinase type I [Venturia nashicola]
MGSHIQVERPSRFATTTSCQRVIYEDFDAEKGTGTLIIQSNLHHAKLFPTIKEHVMNGRILCPSGLYADMALTCADYLYATLAPDAAPAGYNVCAMDVHKTLVVDENPGPDGEHIQIQCVVDLNEGGMDLIIRSVTWDGQILQEHGKGLVKFEDPTVWKAEWERQKYLVHGQIEYLHARYEQGKANLFLRGIAYRLFASLVSYGPKYQGMSEVILDRSDLAGVAKINFQAHPGVDGEFFCSPFYVDNLCHLSGFIVNAQDDIDEPAPLTYISHGWESLKFLQPQDFSPEKEYTSYVRMMPLEEKNVKAGDVYILDGEEIVAVLYGLKFQGIPQRLMDVLLPPIKNSQGRRSNLAKKDGVKKEKKVVVLSGMC